MKAINYMGEVASYLVTTGITALGALLAAYGLFRFARSVLESSLFYLCGGTFLVLTFNREIRFRAINKLPPEVRKYLYEKTAVDAILDLSVGFQSMGALFISGVLRKDEIHRLTDTLPREYQYLNQRGLVHLLPEPLQGMLNPFYSYGEMQSNRGAQGAQLVIAPPREVPVADLPDFAEEPDSSISDLMQETGLRRRRNRDRGRDHRPVAQVEVVRGVEVSGTHYNEGADFFVPPGSPTRAPLIPATIVQDTSRGRSRYSSPIRAHERGHERELATTATPVQEQEDSAPALRSASTSPQVEEVLLEIGMRRLQEAASRGKEMIASGVEYCVTGGDLSDSQLLSAFLGLGVAGGLLHRYDASGPMSRLGADLGGIERDDMRVSGGRMVLRSLLFPFNKAVQSLPPVFYALSAASGGMLAARLSHRHNLYGLANRVALQPLFTLVQDCHTRFLRLYRSVHLTSRDTDWHRAQVAALVTTLSILVAWRMRQTWRQWRWLIAVIMARLKAQAERQASSMAGYFQ